MTSLPSRPTVHAPAHAARLLAALVGAALVGGAGLASAQPSAPDSSPVFPTVSGENLSGRAMTLPRDFGGRANLVFVAFEREHQEVVDTWLPHAARLAASRPGLRYYELPTIKRRFAVMSPVIARGMRSGVTDRAARDATITLYTNVDDLRAALGLPDARSIYALLLDAGGVVRWRARGPYDDPQGAALAAAVDRLLAGDAAGGAR